MEIINQNIYKVIIGGAGGVGKTALIQRFVTGSFATDYKMTIGAAFSVKEITLTSGNKIKLQIWDFAGQEQFRFMLDNYCKGASGALLCYDITDYDTFTQIGEWLSLVRRNAGMIPIILVGNKYDLPNHEVDLETAEKYARRGKMHRKCDVFGER